MKRSRWPGFALLVAATSLVAAGCGGGDSGGSSSGSGGSENEGGGQYVIGVSNTLAGNGWREQMICAVKAQALEWQGQRGHRDLQERWPDRADPRPAEPHLAGRQRHHRQPVRP